MSSPGKKVTDDELRGRSSGSLAWRLARGEQGKTTSQPDDGHVWKVSEAEKDSKVFHLVNFIRSINCGFLLRQVELFLRL